MAGLDEHGLDPASAGGPRAEECGLDRDSASGATTEEEGKGGEQQPTSWAAVAGLHELAGDGGGAGFDLQEREGGEDW